MWSKRRAVVLAGVLAVVPVALCASRAAVADDAAGLAARHRLGLDLGLGSALGGIGVSYQYALAPWQRVEAGVGWGFTGAQLSGMYKLAFGGSHCRFVVGMGPSLAMGGGAAPGHSPDPFLIPWLNLDVPGFECHADSGLSFHMTLGATMPLTTHHWDFTEVGGTMKAGSVYPQGRAGVGWWL